MTTLPQFGAVPGTAVSDWDRIVIVLLHHIIVPTPPCLPPIRGVLVQQQSSTSEILPEGVRGCVVESTAVLVDR